MTQKELDVKKAETDAVNRMNFNLTVILDELRQANKLLKRSQQTQDEAISLLAKTQKRFIELSNGIHPVVKEENLTGEENN